LTRVSTVSVYYGSGTAIRGNRPSIIKKNTVAGVIRTSDDIMHIAGLPKWKDLWNLSRIAKVKSRIRSTKLRLVSMQERLHRYKSNDLKAHREVILRFIAVRSGNKRYDSRSTSNHTEEISKGFETLQTYPVDLFGLGARSQTIASFFVSSQEIESEGRDWQE
jgi:hypothetical protein